MRCCLVAVQAIRVPFTALLAATMSVSCAMRVPEASLQVPPAPEADRSPQNIFLFREVLRFRIRDGKVEAVGFYYFRNPDTVARAFPAAFSFAIDSWQGPPRNLQFMHVSPAQNEDLRFVWLEKNYPLTDLFIAPGNNYCLRVSWEQDLSQNRFVYRLKRQPPWNRQREILRLTLLVPESLRDVRINYPASYEFESESQHAFVLVRDNFIPTEDLVVSWAR